MMIETEKRLHRCCFTGHRPEKLKGSEKHIKGALKKEIHQAIADGFKVFIIGMARGTDLWAAQVVLKLREDNSEIKLICASPYEGFEDHWSEVWKRLYTFVLGQADYVHFIKKCYSPDVFQRRNEWMVNHSARVIAVYNGTPGGTRNTIEYAKRIGVECKVISL